MGNKLLNNLRQIREILSMEGLGLRVKHIGYMPRWVILFLDLTILSFLGVLVYVLFDGMGLQYIAKGKILLATIIFFVVNLFFFRLFRVYSGIIRHSSYIDGIKIFFSQTLAFLTFVFTNLLYEHFSASGEKLFLTTGLLVYFVFSSAALFAYRIFVKRVFDQYLAEKKDGKLVRVMVYGVNANAISLANALKSENPARYKVLGFIDKNTKNQSKRILDLPIIIHNKKVPVLMRAAGAEALVIADETLSKDEKISIVDSCLEYNYKVYSVPFVKDWDNQTEASKKIKPFRIQDLLGRKPIVLDNNNISNQLRGRTVLVTGAAGSIGSEIVWQVLGFNPRHVIVLDQAETPLHELMMELRKTDFMGCLHPEVADVRNRTMMKKVFEAYKPDVVYHAAAYKHVPLMEENPAQAVFTNVLGSKNVADLACEYKVDKFVMVSTDKAVNPSNVMGASKRIAEKYVQSLHNKCLIDQSSTTKFITTRFGNVLGSNGSVVPLFTKQIEEGGPITITHPDIIRYFMTIPEACQLVLEAGSMGNGGEIYIFDMGAPVKIIDLARKMIRLAGYVPDKDIEIKAVGLRPGEKLYEELLNDSAKTLPTHHEKIMVAQEACDDHGVVAGWIDELIIKAYSDHKEELVADMKKIVPEFKSMNSEYELLDKK
jgi:FlaA1/EpsC-like NDP-sugar epimerase